MYQERTFGDRTSAGTVSDGTARARGQVPKGILDGGVSEETQRHRSFEDRQKKNKRHRMDPEILSQCG